jgi:hypothetical protein
MGIRVQTRWVFVITLWMIAGVAYWLAPSLVQDPVAWELAAADAVLTVLFGSIGYRLGMVSRQPGRDHAVRDLLLLLGTGLIMVVFIGYPRLEEIVQEFPVAIGVACGTAVGFLLGRNGWKRNGTTPQSNLVEGDGVFKGYNPMDPNQPEQTFVVNSDAMTAQDEEYTWSIAGHYRRAGISLNR